MAPHGPPHFLGQFPDSLNEMYGTTRPAEPGHIVADLEASSLEAARAEPEYSFRFRRPELYGPLAESL